MKVDSRLRELRRWWEFAALYEQLSQRHCEAASPKDWKPKHSAQPADDSALPLQDNSISLQNTATITPPNPTNLSNTATSAAENPSEKQPEEKIDNQSKSGRQGNGSRQNQIKRQREWVYLSHYIAINGLNHCILSLVKMMVVSQTLL